jgi:hypothetical protein
MAQPARQEENKTKNDGLPDIPTFFVDDDFSYHKRTDARRNRAYLANLWLANKCSWQLTLEDPRAPYRQQVWDARQEPLFVAALEKARPEIARLAREKVMQLMQQSKQDAIQLKSAQYMLEAYEPETYDAGVRRQIRANQGNWINSILQANIPESLKSSVITVDPARPALPAPVVPEELPDNVTYRSISTDGNTYPFPDEIPPISTLSNDISRLDCPQPGAESTTGAEPSRTAAAAAAPTQTFPNKPITE